MKRSSAWPGGHWEAADVADTDLRGLPPDESWLPISVSENPSRGIYLVIHEAGEEVRLSLAGRIASTTTGMESAATVALPLMRCRTGAAAEFLAGTPDGAVRIGVSVAADGGLLTDPQVAMSGATIDTVIPTDGGPPTFALALKGVRIGDGAPRNVSITDCYTSPGERSRRPALGPDQGPRRSCQRCRGPPTGDVGGDWSATCRDYPWTISSPAAAGDRHMGT